MQKTNNFSPDTIETKKMPQKTREILRSCKIITTFAPLFAQKHSINN